MLLSTVRTPRKVQRDGIHLYGLRYFATTLALDVGEAVTIRYDSDLAEIRAYQRDEFLCRAVAPEIAAATISMQDLQAARNERRRETRIARVMTINQLQIVASEVVHAARQMLVVRK